MLAYIQIGGVERADRGSDSPPEGTNDLAVFVYAAGARARFACRNRERRSRVGGMRIGIAVGAALLVLIIGMCSAKTLRTIGISTVVGAGGAFLFATISNQNCDSFIEVASGCVRFNPLAGLLTGAAGGVIVGAVIALTRWIFQRRAARP